jgi:hypothetical protein
LTLRSLIQSDRWQPAWELLRADFCQTVIVRETPPCHPRRRFTSQFCLSHLRNRVSRLFMPHFPWLSKMNICAHSSRDAPLWLCSRSSTGLLFD